MKDEIKEKIKAYYVANDIDKIIDYITNLQEENEELTKARYSLDRVELERRIDKAVDYITTEQLYTNYQWGKSQYEKILKDLLNILKGDDKDE